METYNTPAEIKKLLLLEVENQTIEDEDIQTYLDDAQEELFNDIKRNRETDKFYLKTNYLNDNQEVEFVTYFVISEILEVRDATNNVVISPDNYETSRGSNAIKIKTGENDADLQTTIQIEVDYIPANYKLCERTIAMVNILTRLQPFQNEEINPSLVVWREKRKNYLSMLEGKFGVGSYI